MNRSQTSWSRVVALRCWLSQIAIVLCGALFMVGPMGLARLDAAELADDQPNIVFILCDDLGWGDLGVFYQNTSDHDRTHQTPMLDKMAAEGMQLRAHYCPAPVCAPSRASLLTGVHQGHATVRDNQFDKMLVDNHTLGTVLKAHGYRTAMIGKYGLQGVGEDAQTWTGYPTKRGFDEFFGYVSHYDGHVHFPNDEWALGDSPGHRSPKQVWSNQVEVSSQLAKCYTTDLFTARSKAWIKEHRTERPDQPFFLYLAYDTPHAALQVPSVPYPEGRGLTGGVQWTGKPGKMINTAYGEIDSYRHPDYVERGWTDVEERFATMVRRIDNCVDDLLQTLRDLDIAENTLVVFSSDNGPHHEAYLAGANYDPTSFRSYGDFEGTKRDTWEGGIRLPTLAWWPGKISAGGISGHPSQFHDWMATFAAVAGGTAPARSDGVSLLPTLTGNGKQRAGTVYVEYWQQGTTKPYDDFSKAKQRATRGQMQVIQLNGYKGVRTDIQSHADPFQIYDLKSDPRERHNLAGTSPEFDQLQQAMLDRVLRLRRPNPTAQRPYDAEAIPALDLEDVENGLLWKSYEGSFDYVPSVADLSSTASGVSEAFEVSQSGAKAIEFTGLIKVPKEAAYTFVVTTPQKAFLRIHDVAVVDADFNYKIGQQPSGTVRLKRGYHPIRLNCLTTESGEAQVSVLWSPSGVAPRRITQSQVFHPKP